jgi:hypothetical protein
MMKIRIWFAVSSISTSPAATIVSKLLAGRNSAKSSPPTLDLVVAIHPFFFVRGNRESLVSRGVHYLIRGLDSP